MPLHSCLSPNFAQGPCTQNPPCDSPLARFLAQHALAGLNGTTFHRLCSPPPGLLPGSRQPVLTPTESCLPRQCPSLSPLACRRFSIQPNSSLQSPFLPPSALAHTRVRPSVSSPNPASKAKREIIHVYFAAPLAHAPAEAQLLYSCCTGSRPVLAQAFPFFLPFGDLRSDLRNQVSTAVPPLCLASLT